MQTNLLGLLVLCLVACGDSSTADRIDAIMDAGPESSTEHPPEVTEIPYHFKGPDADEDIPDIRDSPDLPDLADLPDLPPVPELPATIGGIRPAAVSVPDAIEPGRKYPLVLLLHGQGVTGQIQDVYLGLSDRVSSRRFVAVIPDGTPDSAGVLFWNATPGCCGPDGTEVDDVAYLLALVDEAIAALPVDPERVYLIGHSNGAFMAFRLACVAAERLAGIASIAGSIFGGFAVCTPSRPVPALVIHGTADDAVPYGGGWIWGHSCPGAESLTAGWREICGCTADAKTDPAVDFDDAVEGAETTRTRWEDCTAGASVAFWHMEDSGHIPSFNDTFRDALIDAVLGM